MRLVLGSTKKRLAGAVSALLAVLSSGCGPCVPAGGSGRPGASTELRIVSLSPALSRTLVDFGLADNVVGRTPFCRSLDPGVPVVGSLLDVDFELLVKVMPTHLLVQPPAGGIDPDLGALAAQHGWTVGEWHIDTIDDIERLILDLPDVLFDVDSPQHAEAVTRAAELVNEIAAVLSPGGDQRWPWRTLLVSDAHAVSVFGRGTYMNDLLLAMGGTNAIDVDGYPQLSLEDVVRLDPEAIILIVPGLSQPADPVAAAGALGTLEISAVRDGRVAWLAHPDVLVPSSGVVDVAREFRRVLRTLAGTGP